MVIVVADRSSSMPPQAATVQEEIIRLLERSRRPRDELGVISFGRRAVVESVPQRGNFPGFRAEVGPDQSALADALELALTLIPADAGGRILVLSDGKWTGRDPMGAAARAAARGVAVDYRLLSRPQAGDLAIQSFDVPQSAAPGEGVLMTAWISVPRSQEIRYRLLRGELVVASGRREVEGGLTRLMFRDLAPGHGVTEYLLEVEGAADDPVLENNRARALLTVRGEPTLLLASEAGERSGLARLLQSGGIHVVARRPELVRWSADALMGYDAVLLEQVPASAVGGAGLETLATWVEVTGRGLMLTGGPKGYGAGGYFLSPLERVLPVSLESPREHLKMSVAIVVALDRSGSMAMPVGDGRTKMDLANLGTVQVLDMLGPQDELGVIAVDSSPHIIVPLGPVSQRAAERSRILSIESAGGGIFIYEALSAAVRMIVESRAQRRHIILFADAADSEEPGAYRELLEKCREAGITVSVIGLGTEADQDADLLKEIAARGGGECYFTADAHEIPRLFAQDTFVVARLAFVEELTPIRFTPERGMLGLTIAEEPPPIGGYNLCFLRPGARQAVVTADENATPVVAFWNAGLGRVLAFCGEADGQHAGPLASWPRVGDFYATLARWTMGRGRANAPDLLVTQEIRDGAVLRADPSGSAEKGGTLPGDAQGDLALGSCGFAAAAGGAGVRVAFGPICSRRWCHWRAPKRAFKWWKSPGATPSHCHRSVCLTPLKRLPGHKDAGPRRWPPWLRSPADANVASCRGSGPNCPPRRRYLSRWRRGCSWWRRSCSWRRFGSGTPGGSVRWRAGASGKQPGPEAESHRTCQASGPRDHAGTAPVVGSHPDTRSPDRGRHRSAAARRRAGIGRETGGAGRAPGCGRPPCRLGHLRRAARSARTRPPPRSVSC
ncbi:MAG: hypothetical protein KatS3mg132_451 [Limisphaera sp.]|nr:MAG: hypothetical protein KatS3mg132_451 [Limisphaera sp.]